MPAPGCADDPREPRSPERTERAERAEADCAGVTGTSEPAGDDGSSDTASGEDDIFTRREKREARERESRLPPLALHWEQRKCHTSFEPSRGRGKPGQDRTHTHT